MKKYITNNTIIPSIYLIDPQRTRYVFKELRENCDISQKEFADEIGVDIKTVQGWEQGRGTPSKQMLKKICEISGLTIQDILLPDAPKMEIVPKEKRRVKYTAKSVGEYLENILRSEGITIKDAAEVFGTVEYTVEKWIEDKGTALREWNINALPRLACFAGVSLDELVEGIYPDDLNPAKSLGLERFVSPEGNAFNLLTNSKEDKLEFCKFIEGMHRFMKQIEAYINETDELNLNELEYLFGIYVINYEFIFKELSTTLLISDDRIIRILEPEEIRNFIEYLKTSDSPMVMDVSTIAKLLYLDFMNQIQDKKLRKGSYYDKIKGIKCSSDSYNILFFGI